MLMKLYLLLEHNKPKIAEQKNRISHFGHINSSKKELDEKKIIASIKILMIK